MDPSREVSVHYHYGRPPKLGIFFVGEGIYQDVMVQGDPGSGWVQRGLHQVMRVRCPDLTIPEIDVNAPDAEREASCRRQLEFCAAVLRDHFGDFLEGDPGVLGEVR